MKTNKFFAFLILCVFCFIACNNESAKTPLDTPTKGIIKIAVDESFKPLAESLIAAFMGLYPNTTIIANYVSETEAYKLMLLDSVRLAIGTRKLNDEENQFFKNKKIVTKDVKIASDAIALIVNKDNTDSSIQLEAFKKIINGDLTTWKELNNKNIQGPINIICDNTGSSTVGFIKSNYLIKNEFPKNFYALKNNIEVIDYVKKNKNAIGIIGVSWISDGDDPLSDSLRKLIKVLAIKGGDKSDPEAYKPYQAYLSLKKYPLTREVMVVSGEARTGLGSGFTSFLAGDKGQRIILKCGLLPSTMPVRIVGFNSN